MSQCNSTYLLLCYTRISPLIIEIILFILSIIGSIVTYYGLSRIPFHIDSKIYRIVFFINIPYFILIIILNLIFLIFRYYNLMVNELNLWGYGLSIVEVYITLFGIITNLINDSLILSNMKYYEEITLKQNSSKYPLITSKEWLYTKIVLPIILFFWLNMLLMSLADNLLINLRINGSYYSYELALKLERNYNKNHNNNDEDIDNQNQENNSQENNDNDEDIENTNEEKISNNENSDEQGNNQNKINLQVNPNINHELKINYNNNNSNTQTKFKDYRRNEENQENKSEIKVRDSINPFLNNENNMKEDLKNSEEIKI